MLRRQRRIAHVRARVIAPRVIDPGSDPTLTPWLSPCRRPSVARPFQPSRRENTRVGGGTPVPEALCCSPNTNRRGCQAAARRLLSVDLAECRAPHTAQEETFSIRDRFRSGSRRKRSRPRSLHSPATHRAVVTSSFPRGEDRAPDGPAPRDWPSVTLPKCDSENPWANWVLSRRSVATTASRTGSLDAISHAAASHARREV
jgi:hypothetical protein